MHRLNDGATFDKNANGENNSNGDKGNIGDNVATVTIGTILLPLKPLSPLATVFYQRIIIVISFILSLANPLGLPDVSGEGI